MEEHSSFLCCDIECVFKEFVRLDFCLAVLRYHFMLQFPSRTLTQSAHDLVRVSQKVDVEVDMMDWLFDKM